jgi:hypothetical protein
MNNFNLLCLLGFHKFKKKLAFTITVHRKTHHIHGKVCIRCGYAPPVKGEEYARIFGKR